MQVCRALISVFVETDMAHMEGLRKQSAMSHALMIRNRSVGVIMLIQCTLYLNVHAIDLKILMKI